ncbi:FAD-dependent monooxygenase [Cryptosporangium sp. NPDC048952]|uniref:FAD-dependent monooxygenase n=1 Tax=Cryptosporangium sp. NPDC048952 TaxID=3363961 RepID=UPI003719B75A
MDEFPVVIVGGGPVGLTASILLSKLGVRHALFERHPGTSIHPKAIGLNQRTIEIFRSAGLGPDIAAAAAPPRTVSRTAWYTSFGGPTPLHGRQIAIRDAWGGGAYAEEYAAASPAPYTMLPQIRLEPILRAHASASPLATIEFGTAVTGISDGVVLLDDGRRIPATYVIAADGGRTVADAVGIGVTGPTNLVDMVSAHFAADLSDVLPDDSCLINWFVNPDLGGSIGSGFLYHLGPWSADGVSAEWVFACGFGPDDPERFDEDGMRARITRSLGVPIELELKSVSHWYIQSVVADRFRAGGVFLAGDAAHRIPPWGALGLNTGVQDVHNLTWKIAAALADPSLSGLLDTYETERRPIALSVARTSLHNFQNHGGVVDVALGLAEGWSALETLWSGTSEGAAKQATLDEAMTVLDKEFHAHGAENGFSYPSGAVVPEPGEAEVDMLIYAPTSAPGHHVPHAWTAPGVSTLDLARPGRFALIVDSAADAWREALAKSTSPLAPLIDIVTVPGDGDWGSLREVDPDGALLIRPDTIVAWRANSLPSDPATTLDEALTILTS